VISDRPASHKRVSEYARRRRVEATFQDTKSRGCLIECSRFKNRDHLDRWVFIMGIERMSIARIGAIKDSCA
jgi:uncharacterized protein YchJ